MRSAAWITSCAWSRYATKARAATTAVPKTMRTGLDRRLARGRVNVGVSASNASLANDGSSSRGARATITAGAAAATAAPRWRASIGGTVTSGHASGSASRGTAAGGAASPVSVARLCRGGVSPSRLLRAPPRLGTPAVRRSRRSARPRESACHCGSGRPGTGWVSDQQSRLRVASCRCTDGGGPAAVREAREPVHVVAGMRLTVVAHLLGEKRRWTRLVAGQQIQQLDVVVRRHEYVLGPRSPWTMPLACA